MNQIKIGATVVLFAVAIGAGIFAARQWSAAQQAEANVGSLATRQSATAAQIAALESRLQEQAKRAEAIEADNATLRDALVRAEAARAAAAKSVVPMTRQALEDRFKSVRELGRSGDPAEALRELLWWWDVGLKQGNSATAPARKSRLVDELRDLAQRYPPAREELQRRRDALRERILASPGGGDSVSDYMSVLRVLGEQQAALSLMDKIPAGDRRRSTLSIYAGEQLIEAKRYAEAMEGKSAGTMFSRFEIDARMAAASRPAPDGGPSYFVKSAVRDIELLAGSGHLADARELAKRLLAVDGSDNTRALIQKHAERAGQPDLLSPRAP